MCLLHTFLTVLVSAFLYTDAPFPSCHASTIAETEDGTLVAAFFGGTREGADDVKIWLCRLEPGSEVWSTPVVVAEADEAPCWNPVLFQIPGGDLLLFYKSGRKIPQWQGHIKRSSDGGKTWSSATDLPAGILGAIKNKPVWLNGRILCPSSDESGRWQCHFEISDDLGKSWRKVGPVSSPDDFQTIQPTILIHNDGSLQALCRSKNGRMAMTRSFDRGECWSGQVLTDIPQNNSGLDAVTLADGRFAMVYNPVTNTPGTQGGPRTPLCLALSLDGIHWSNYATLEDEEGEYSYPSIIQGHDGTLHIVYTWRRERVKYVRIKL